MDIAQRTRQAVESLLENETLTADLDDEAADALLQWGIDCATRIVQDTAVVGDTLSADESAVEEATYPRMRALRRMLREINEWASGGNASDPAALLQIVTRASIVYERDLSVVTAQIGRLVLELTAMSDQPARQIAQLRQLLERAVGA